MTLMTQVHLNETVMYRVNPYAHASIGRVVGVSIKSIDVEDDEGTRHNNVLFLHIVAKWEQSDE